MNAIYKDGRYKKPVISRLMLQLNNYEWKMTKDEKPELNKCYIVRLCDNSILVDEDDLHVYVAEDICMADYTEKGWSITPPYPKFEIGRLSHRAEIYNSTEVTHWAVPTQRDIDDWKTRLDIPKDKYNLVELKVAESDAELIHEALTMGITAIVQSSGSDFYKDPNSRHNVLCSVLYDLTNIMKIIPDEEVESDGGSGGSGYQSSILQR